MIGKKQFKNYINHKYTLLLLIIFLRLFIDIIWIFQSDIYVGWDSAAYKTYSLIAFDIASTLTNLNSFFSDTGWNGIGFFYHLLSFNRVRPPLVYYGTIPFYFIFGRLDIVPELSNILYTPVTIISIYFIAQKIFQDRVSKYLAACSVAFFPVLIGMSHQVWQENPLIAFTTASICLFLYNEDYASRKHSILLGLSIGFGFLSKETFIVFIFLPFLYTVKKINFAWFPSLGREIVQNTCLWIKVFHNMVRTNNKTPMIAIWLSFANFSWLVVGFTLQSYGPDASIPLSFIGFYIPFLLLSAFGTFSIVTFLCAIVTKLLGNEILFQSDINKNLVFKSQIRALLLPSLLLNLYLITLFLKWRSGFAFTLFFLFIYLSYFSVLWQSRKLSKQFSIDHSSNNERNFVLCVATAISLAGSWYVFSFKNIIQTNLQKAHNIQFSVGPIFSQTNLQYYPNILLKMFLGPIIFTLCLFALLLLLIQLIYREKKKVPIQTNSKVIILSWVTVPLLIFTLITTKSPRFIMPIIPSFSILIGSIANSLQKISDASFLSNMKLFQHKFLSKKIVLNRVVSMILVGFFFFQALLLHINLGRPTEIYNDVFGSVSYQSYWSSYPLESNKWKQVVNKMFDTISDDAAHRHMSSPIRVGFLSDHSNFNAQGVRYYSYLYQLPFQIINGLRENERFMEMFEAGNISYYILKSDAYAFFAEDTQKLNITRKIVLNSDPILIKTYLLPDQTFALLYRNSNL